MQVFKGALLLAVVLEQAAQGVDLFVDRVGFGRGFLEQDFQAVAQLGQLLRGLLGALLKTRQLLAPGAEVIAQAYQLLQPWAVGIPGTGQWRQFAAAFQLRGNLRKAFSALLLAFEQAVEGLLPLVAGLLGLLLKGLLAVQGLSQAIEIGLFQVRLLYPWCGFTLFVLCPAGCPLRVLQLAFKPGLALAQFGLLQQVGADVCRQRAQLCGEFGQPGKLMALRGQLFQQMQGLALRGLAVPQGLCLVQLLGGAVSLLLQLAQGFEPAVLLFQLLELALLVL